MKATEGANYLVYLMSDSFDDLTNMKVNKLLYLSQGYYLRKYGKTLFDDPIEAWDHGPVIPSVYSTYKEFGDKPITTYDAARAKQVPEEAREIFLQVARKYGERTAAALRRMTHVAGSPWAKVYQEGQAHVVIPVPLILSYFQKQGDIELPEASFAEDDFVGYRDSNDILVLPKEWDDEEV